MPPHNHHATHDHHTTHPGHGGHTPIGPYTSWGWQYPPEVQTIFVEEPTPQWVWIAGGALAGILLAMLSRGR